MQDSDAIILKVQDLSLLYEPDIGLKCLNMTVEQGQIYGFLGRNGAGKSTSLQILSGIYRPQQGTITYRGESASKIKTQWKESIGFVAQLPSFPNKSVPNGVARLLKRFYPTWQPERLARALDLFQLPADKPISGFSVGMQRCLAFVFAYAIDPAIYILDEPTAGLDIIARKILLDLLEEEAANKKSAILSTHIVDDVSEICHQLGIIHGGVTLKEAPIEVFGVSPREIEAAYLELIKNSAVASHP